MWIVAKVRNKELNIFKQNLINRLGKEIKFYYPKIEYQKIIKNKLRKFEKILLENYVFCYHTKFNKINSLNEIRYVKGLTYFLNGYGQNQKEIVQFINHCKVFENEKGYLTSSFFKDMIISKARFVSGPLTNMIFEIIERQKNKIKILLGNIVTTIPDKKNYLYLSI